MRRLVGSMFDERAQKKLTLLKTISDSVDALLHPSARHDTLASARHRAFIAPRLFGSLAIFAAFPIYLATRGAPRAVEVAAFGWLIAPILLCYFLSRTGRFETAYMLWSLALASLILLVSVNTGGLDSSAAIWLLVLPIEAALSASRRAIGFACALALASALLLVALGHFALLPRSLLGAEAQTALMGFGLPCATVYAAALAFGTDALSRIGIARLSVEEHRYRLLARNMSDVISRHRRNGAVLFISPAAETLLGARAAQLLGYGLFDRVHVADRPAFLTALSDAGRGGEARSVEFRVRRDLPRGERGRACAADFIWLEMRCRPMEASADPIAVDETEVVAVMRDVTDRKNQEHALGLARGEAERADASKSRFLATMSHELRTPLNAIIGFSEMIAQEDVLMIGAERRKEYAQLINDSGTHLLSVVNGILDMSKMESGNFEIVPEPFAPRPALMSCCNLLALKARENDIDLVARASEHLPLVHGDVRAFRQIVLNLVSNAIKFTERGGAVTVSAAAEGARLALRVSDTGVGISEDDLKRVGDPFFQAGKTYQRRHEGTGLGLSIVKSLVALHGGEMNVESVVDQGTTVTVKLPLAQIGNNIATLNPASPPEIKAGDYQVKRSA